MVSRRKILSRSRDDLTLGEERTKHTQVRSENYDDYDDDDNDDANDDNADDDDDLTLGEERTKHFVSCANIIY